ncbi:MAG: hypothetical protein WC821_02795 [archaeon]|jgi:hypothetical protein
MNNKGFGGLLVVLAVFLVGALLFSMNIETKNQVSIKELPIEAKLFTNNFELNLTRIASDCNWSKTVAEITSCVDSNAISILNRLNSVHQTNCSKLTTTTLTVTPKQFSFTLDCNLVKQSNEENLVKLIFKRKVKINVN